MTGEALGPTVPPRPPTRAVPPGGAGTGCASTAPSNGSLPSSLQERRNSREIAEFLTALALAEQLRGSNFVPRPDNPAAAVLAKDTAAETAERFQREIPREVLEAAVKTWRELCPQEGMQDRILRTMEDFAGPATVRKLSEISQTLRGSMRGSATLAGMPHGAEVALNTMSSAAGAAAGRAADVASVWVGQFESWLASNAGEVFIDNMKGMALSLAGSHELSEVLGQMKTTIGGGTESMRHRFLAANPSLVHEYRSVLEEALDQVHAAIGDASPELQALIDEATAGMDLEGEAKSRDIVSFLLLLAEPDKRAALLRQIMLLGGRFLTGSVRLARIPRVTGDYFDWTGSYDWELRDIALTEVHIPMQCAQLIVRPNAISIQFTNVRLKSEGVHWVVKRKSFPPMTFRGDADADILIRRLALPIAVGVKGDVPVFEVEKRPLIFGPMDLKFSKSRASWLLNQFSRVLSEGMIEESEKFWNEEIAKVSGAIVKVMEQLVAAHWGAAAAGKAASATPQQPRSARSLRTRTPQLPAGSYAEAAVQTDPEPEHPEPARPGGPGPPTPAPPAFAAPRASSSLHPGAPPPPDDDLI
eukprot:tig00000553_g2079.t1